MVTRVMDRQTLDLGALPNPPSSLMSLATFKRLISPKQKADLINGVFVMASPASYAHEQMFAFLMKFLGMYVEANDLGVVLGSRMLVEVDDQNGYEPDLLFVSKDRLSIIREDAITGPPDLVVEIISPGSRRHDAYDKKAGYEWLGVREYWLIDPDNRKVVFYQLGDQGYRPIKTQEGVYHSSVSPDLRLKVDRLWPDAEGRHRPVADLLRKLGALL